MPKAKAKPDALPFVVLTADALFELVERVGALERRCRAIEERQERDFEALCEHIPTVADGGLKITAFSAGGEGTEDVIVPLLEPAPAT